MQEKRCEREQEKEKNERLESKKRKQKGRVETFRKREKERDRRLKKDETGEKCKTEEARMVEREKKKRERRERESKRSKAGAGSRTKADRMIRQNRRAKKDVAKDMEQKISFRESNTELNADTSLKQVAWECSATVDKGKAADEQSFFKKYGVRKVYVHSSEELLKKCRTTCADIGRTFLCLCVYTHCVKLGSMAS